MTKLGPYILGPNDTPENGIYLGDAHVLAEAIPDKSIDLIFTDPVYQNIDDYRWLAETGARVLKDDRACLVWIANPRIDLVIETMKPILDFVMPLNYVKIGGTNLIFSRRIFGWSKMCLWFEHGKSMPHHAIPDTILSGAMPATAHKWNKNPEAVIKWLYAFTLDDAIVFDPFTGSGTIPSCCIMRNRQYLAFEILPDVVEMARERVRNTQSPLFIQQEEQLELMES